jgi:hypothetical protein
MRSEELAPLPAVAHAMARQAGVREATRHSPGIGVATGGGGRGCNGPAHGLWLAISVEKRLDHHAKVRRRLRDADIFWGRLVRGLMPHGYRRKVAPRLGEGREFRGCGDRLSPPRGAGGCPSACQSQQLQARLPGQDTCVRIQVHLLRDRKKAVPSNVAPRFSPLP